MHLPLRSFDNNKSQICIIYSQCFLFLLLSINVKKSLSKKQMYIKCQVSIYLPITGFDKYRSRICIIYKTLYYIFIVRTYLFTKSICNFQKKKLINIKHGIKRF